MIGAVLRIANLGVRAALLALVGAIAFGDRVEHTGPAGLAAEIGALAIAAALLLAWVPANRTAPLRVRGAALLPYGLAAMIVSCGLASATSTGGVFNLLAATAALSAGSDTSPAAGFTVTGLGVATVELTGALTGAPPAVLLGYPLGLVLGLAIGRNLRAGRVQAEQAARLLAEAERVRAEHARAAALDERARIAREIHDVLAHSLGALGLQLQLAHAVLTERHDEAAVAGILGRARRLADDGLTETRRAIQVLRGETLPLPEGLAELGAEHELRLGAPVRLTVTGDPGPLPADVGVTLLRTAQEALVNAAKYAPGAPVAIGLDRTGGATALTVRNRPPAAPGPAPFATADGGYGLAGLRERLLLLDGALTAGPDGAGWVVVATVPDAR
jgi:signal transduction histidine kinase